MDTIKCNGVIEQMLSLGNAELGKLFLSDVIFLKAPMRQPIDDIIKDEIEELRSRRRSKSKILIDKLTVIVETNGGSIEVVERIVSVFRKHYDFVEYVVPNYAYSAGTILVLSGDELYMDYYSILGPIDPQMDTGESYVPGMGYLAKFNELAGIINKASDPSSTRAEMAYLITKFDPAKLFLIEQAVEHSKALLRAWLPQYKFKNWTTKESSGDAVTDGDRKKRAEEIADCLGNAKRWHSHGRGISIKELASEEIKLKVVNYGENKELTRNISNYYGLFVDYLAKLGYGGALHTARDVRRLA